MFTTNKLVRGINPGVKSQTDAILPITPDGTHQVSLSVPPFTPLSELV
jgi:hypothetical protein